MNITDGYTFRNTFASIKQQVDDVVMLMSERTIKIEFLSDTKSSLTRIIFRTDDLSSYTYNIQDETGALYQNYPIGFNTTDMLNTLRNVGKKDSLRIYWLKGDNKMCVQPVKGKADGSAGALFVKIIAMEYNEYNFSELDYPNVRVQTKNMADIFNQIVGLKCTSMLITGRKNSVEFKGTHADGSTACIDQIMDGKATQDETRTIASNIDEFTSMTVSSDKAARSLIRLNIVKSDDITSVSVPITLVKALSKVYNISPVGSNVKFYFAVGKPIQLETPIGTYGTYTMFLRNPSNT